MIDYFFVTWSEHRKIKACFALDWGVEAPWTAPTAEEANGLVLFRGPQSAKHALYIFLSEHPWNQKNTSIAAQSYLLIKNVSGDKKTPYRATVER